MKRLQATNPNNVVRSVCLALLILGGCASSGSAFVLSGTTAANSRWAGTSHGLTGTTGSPATLTWSIVPDGTSMFELDGINQSPSNMVAQFDATFGAGGGGSDYTNRPWFSTLEQVYDRWEELSGLTFVYEPNDDGITHSTGLGQLGVRGDIRMAGIGLDGNLGSLAYNYFPSDGGDTGIDTDDMAYFSDTSSNFLRLRNTLMHEMGHGLGLDHTTSNSSNILLEPTISTAFDGPQHDDLRGIHWFYGDSLEKTNGGQGNNTAANSTDLGFLAAGGMLDIGTAGNGTVIGGNETDFVSIANPNDFDYFAFTTTAPVTLDALMTPRGATYDQGAGTSFVTTESSNLSLTLYDTNGVSVLAQETSGAAGVAESIAGVVLATPGEYFLRVEMVDDLAVAEDVVQFYELEISATSLLPLLAGDYNLDGTVNAADYTHWRDTVGQTGIVPYSGADGDGNGVIGSGDYSVWISQYGATVAIATSVPEPTTLILLLTAGLLAGRCKGRRGVCRFRLLPANPSSDVSLATDNQ